MIRILLLFAGGIVLGVLGCVAWLAWYFRDFMG